MDAGSEREPAVWRIGDGAERRIYFQVEQDKIIAVVAIASDFIPVYVVGKWGDAGWVPGRDCTRQDVPFTSYVSIAPPTMNCLYISHDTMTRSGSQAWSDAKSRARQFGGFIRPMVYTSIRLRSVNRSDWLEALVFVDPAKWGFTAEPNVAWVDSSWQKDNIDQKHQAFVDTFSRWALAYRERLRQSWE